MSERSVYITEHFNLDKIKLINPDTRFPWIFFKNGKVNCVFQLPNSENINDIRIWINNNIEDSVYLEYSCWSRQSINIAFANPNDAIKFNIQFGEIIKKLDG